MTTPANPHDALFKCLLDDPNAAAALIRDALPASIQDQLSSEAPVLVDATFIDPALRETRGDRLFQVLLKDGSPALVYVLLERDDIRLNQPDV